MKPYQSQIVVLFVLIFTHLATPEYYTAVVELEKLMHTERELANLLGMYLKNEEKRLEKVKWLAMQYGKIHQAANHGVETFLSNPVNAFLLVKRLTSDWKAIYKFIEKSNSEAFKKIFKSLRLSFPNSDDLSGAAEALLRLQEVYLLDTASIAQGHIQGTKLSYELAAGDCFELGRQAYHRMDFQRSIMWMNESVNRFQKETIKTVPIQAILGYMALAHASLGYYRSAAELTQQILTIAPGHKRALKDIVFYRAHLANDGMVQKTAIRDITEMQQLPEKPSAPKVFSTEALTTTYEMLCRGKSTKTPKEESKLYCYYTTNNNAYFLLQPVKVEVLNLKPQISMYYDVLNEEEINAIKSISHPKLERSSVVDPSGTNVHSSNRISKSTWLSDDEHRLIPHINRRIEAFTGLSIASAENLQVVNYGIGGYYRSHTDWVSEINMYPEGVGNRIATVIYYLSDVSAGGFTVFPLIGVTVRPVKGAAAFWYNLHRNGTGDVATWHAACPVLSGSKWIANKWLHEGQNEFKRPCSLNQLE